MTAPGRRLNRLLARETVPARRSMPALASTGVARALVTGLLAVQLAVLLGGWVGVAAGVVAALLLPRWLAGLEPLAARRRRQRVQSDLPLGLDLLVVSLRAGSPVPTAVGVVAAAVGGPLGSDLARAAARLELGGDPRGVWAELADDSVLGRIGRAVVRAVDTGAPVADSLTHLVEDLRRDRLLEADELARRVAVRSAGPLGLCFLPAFVLVGVAPTVIGAFSALLG